MSICIIRTRSAAAASLRQPLRADKNNNKAEDEKRGREEGDEKAARGATRVHNTAEMEERHEQPRIRTSLTDMLGIEHPIVQGGMHLVSCVELCAAISNSGCLGTLTALSNGTAENLRKEIRRVRARTSKPFAVNLTLLPALNPPDYASFCDVIIEERVPVAETAGRSPEKYIRQLKAGGVKVIHKCTTIRHALAAEVSVIMEMIASPYRNWQSF